MSDENKIVRFISREEAAEEAKEESFRDYKELEEYTDEGQSARLLSGIANIGNGVSRIQIPRNLDRNAIKTAFDDAFALIGGVPRLAAWADKNPGDFFKLYARMLPSSAKAQIEHSGGITINHVLPKGPLDE